jgi:hypothetical protein
MDGVMEWPLMVCSTLPIVLALLLQTIDVGGLVLRDAHALYGIASGIDEVDDMLFTEDLQVVSPSSASLRSFIPGVDRLHKLHLLAGRYIRF